MDETKISSNKSFGIVFFVVFLSISIYPITYDGGIRIWSLLIALIFLFLGLINSRILTPFNILWFKLGIILGKFVSPIIMFIIFFAVVTPIGLFMKIIKKDLLGLKFSSKKSYWIENNSPKSKMKNQF